MTRYYRLLNRDGTFNISRAGVHRAVSRDLYHTLLSVGWGKFLALLGAFYLLLNGLFAIAYTLCGEGALEGAATGSLQARFRDSFFFSVQTLATIGYGKITPTGLAANCLVTVEALFGLLGLAIMTGLLFARFSKPTARVLFSDKAMVTAQDGVPCFMFRMANARLNQIVEARVKVSLAINEKTAEGERYRNFYPLELERSESPIFALSWTVVHPLVGTSPLKGLSYDQLLASEAEIFVSLVGTDETFSQTIHTRTSYIPTDIVWDGQFEDMLSRDGSNRITIDLDRIHQYRKKA